MGVQVAPPYRALQEFMVAQMNAGMLLCLCSKNNEKDAVDVFDQRNDMPLKREHLVSWRLNWKSKSENIKSLAKELNVGLDTFIFIDDNPVDCADVRINCPGALTLQLPQNPESFATFFEHVWAFDRAASSQEDQSRTRMYRENAERDQLRERSISLKNFIDGLQLRVEVGEPREDQIARISQLTFRTNQFNFTTIRRSETEIRDFLLHEGNNGLVVRVADRFGDYGLVGLVLYHTTPDRYNVDTFLLSCRVLGRGVEHAVVSALGKQALNEGRRFVEIKFWPTEKNLPALEFVTRIGNEYRDNDGTSWTFPAESLAAVQYNPDEGAPQITTAEKVWHGSALADNGIYNSERLQRIAEELCDSERLGKAIEEYRRGRQPAAAAPAVSGDATESALLNIWRRVLALPAIGLNDNFFEAGGTSLRAVQVIAMIKKELKQNLSIVSLFECPTVSLLAAKLKGAASPESNTGNAAARGQRRRYNMGGRPSPRAAA